MADVSKLYEKAADYLKRKNFDPAIDLFKQILALDPNYAAARKDLRKAEIEKFDAQGYPPKFLAQIGNLPSYVKILVFSLVKNYDRLAMVCEDVLARDPRNAGTGLRLGHALWKGGYMQSALAAFEAILDWSPSDFDALVACGDLSKATGNLDAAIQYFAKAQKANPRDKHVTDSIRDISAMISIKPREQAGSYRDLIHSDEKSRKQQQKSREDEVSIAKQRVKQNPGDVKAWFDLGDLLERKGMLKEALEAFDKAVSIAPADEDVLSRRGDAKIALLESRAASARKDAEALGRPDSAGTLAKMEAEKSEFEIAEFRRRSSLYPTDLGLRFSLGGALFRAGKTDEAVAEFQQSKKDPKRNRESSFWIGRCFLESRKFNLAVKQFQVALEQDPTLDSLGKDIHYFMGKARIGENDKDSARKHFETIYEEDINFKDVSKLIEELGK